VRVALAGRSAERLRTLREDLGERAAGWSLVVVDAADEEGLAEMARRSHVVVTTVGPYQRHGLLLVAACAEAGTDYADLTGEVLFVRDAIEQSHERARRTGARIVVSCGFDSVPSDLAVHLLHRAAQADGAGGLTDTTLWVRRLRGGISGGTIDSLRVTVARLRDDPALRRVVGDPESLSGGRAGAPGQREVWRPFVEQDSGEWAAPFVMASYNTRVVRRSDALLGSAYGPRFRYRELVPCGRGAAGAVRSGGLVLGLGLGMGGMAVPALAPVLDRVLPSPGEGPSAAERAAGSFRTETVTTTEDGSRYAATVAASGDPGYAATSGMLGESALTLLETRRPGGGQGAGSVDRSGGVLTPAVALGDRLVGALRRRGFTLEVRRLSPAART
jgi:short subunit dehydrogenase-like uncharacterized protein